MSTSITSIVPIDELAKLVAPTGAPSTPSVSQESVSKFESLMNRPGNENSTHEVSTKNVIGSILESEQNGMKATENKLKDYIQEMPNLSPQEQQARSMVLSSEMTMSNVKLTIGSSLMQATNKSLQSLLKNQ
jgi:type III secretion system HrpB2-like protein